MSAAPAAPAADPAADLLPARMLNEFVYCPRLFYYEHVEGVFLHSADTRRGAAEHARVDSGSGALPESKAVLRRKPVSETSDAAETTDEGGNKMVPVPGANAHP